MKLNENDDSKAHLSELKYLPIMQHISNESPLPLGHLHLHSHNLSFEITHLKFLAVRGPNVDFGRPDK